MFILLLKKNLSSQCRIRFHRRWKATENVLERSELSSFKPGRAVLESAFFSAVTSCGYPKLAVALKGDSTYPGDVFQR